MHVFFLSRCGWWFVSTYPRTAFTASFSPFTMSLSYASVLYTVRVRVDLIQHFWSDVKTGYVYM